MDVIFDWNLDNMIYNGLITLRRCGFPFVEIGVVSILALHTDPSISFTLHVLLLLMDHHVYLTN